MKKVISFFIIAGFLIFAAPASAHPGRTDAKGGHVCNTNCEKWGVEKGKWHSHGAVTAPAAKTESKTVAKSETKTKAKTVATKKKK